MGGHSLEEDLVCYYCRNAKVRNPSPEEIQEFERIMRLPAGPDKSTELNALLDKSSHMYVYYIRKTQRFPLIYNPEPHEKKEIERLLLASDTDQEALKATRDLITKSPNLMPYFIIRKEEISYQRELERESAAKNNNQPEEKKDD